MMAQSRRILDRGYLPYLLPRDSSGDLFGRRAMFAPHGLRRPIRRDGSGKNRPPGTPCVDSSLAYHRGRVSSSVVLRGPPPSGKAMAR